jgi:hypothetical protein
MTFDPRRRSTFDDPKESFPNEEKKCFANKGETWEKTLRKEPLSHNTGIYMNDMSFDSAAQNIHRTE